ncbi:MAG TPA: histidine phosphatase family protein [Erysipelothrix sp.]|nr:histidine phosphatase family protein [Erysipelothrix sp.]
MSKMKVVLVRHGYTEGNDQGLYTGWSDTMLSKKGIEELHELKKTYAYPKTDRYYTSDLTRAIDTFNILYENEKAHESTFAFREVYFGDYEDQRWDKVKGIPYNEAYIRNQPHVSGETISQVSLRLFGKLSQVLKDMKDNGEDSVTIVCHSGVIRTFIMFLTPLSFDNYYRIDTPNGLGYILDVDFDEDNHYPTLNRYEPIPLKK